MKIMESAENYLETILMLQNRQGSVRSIDIATELGFSKPSVSIAMKNFRENGYITVDDNGHIKLTEAGLEIASHVYERHLVLTRLLIDIGVDEAHAKEDACRIEHDISDETFACIKAHVEALEA
jgi:Mn-dependent DtxR family transcriptional regulator